MTKWHGTVVHLRVEKLQPRRHVHWRYRVAAAVSQSREFRPKIENEFYEFFFEFFSTRLGQKNFRDRKKISIYQLRIF